MGFRLYQGPATRQRYASISAGGQFYFSKECNDLFGDAAAVVPFVDVEAGEIGFALVSEDSPDLSSLSIRRRRRAAKGAPEHISVNCKGLAVSAGFVLPAMRCPVAPRPRDGLSALIVVQRPRVGAGIVRRSRTEAAA